MDSHPKNKANALIDYIFQNKKWINSALNWEIYSFFEGVSSDVKIVTANIHLNLCRNTTQTAKNTEYDWSSFNNRDISNKYTITQRDKLNDLLEIFETLIQNDDYENFISADMEAAAADAYQPNKEPNIMFHRRY